MDYAKIAAATRCPQAKIEANWPTILICLQALHLDSPKTQIATLATVAVETAYRFEPIHEFGKRPYFAKYDHRADLGNHHDGDGYTYRGAGYIQITGEANFARYGALLGIDMLACDAPGNPDKACDPMVAADILAAYFRDHHINVAADAGNWTRVRELVNGGHNGLPEFLAIVNKLKEVIQ